MYLNCLDGNPGPWGCPQEASLGRPVWFFTSQCEVHRFPLSPKKKFFGGGNLSAPPHHFLQRKFFFWGVVCTT